MVRPRVDAEHAKKKRKLRNDRYRANVEKTERNKEKNKLYQRKKREQARLRLHPDPLARLADTMTQQLYLRDVSVMQISPEPRTQEIDQELIDDTGATIEEDGDILNAFEQQSEQGNDEDFNEDEDGGEDKFFDNELEPDRNVGFFGGFDDEEGDRELRFDHEDFSNGPDLGPNVISNEETVDESNQSEEDDSGIPINRAGISHRSSTIEE